MTDKATSVPVIWDGSYKTTIQYAEKFDAVKQLCELIRGRFVVEFKMSEIMCNLYMNDEPILVRKSKFGPIWKAKNVTILEGTDAGYGGSNTYPHISFKEGYCVLRVETEGMPGFPDFAHKYKIDVTRLEKI